MQALHYNWGLRLQVCFNNTPIRKYNHECTLCWLMCLSGLKLAALPNLKFMEKSKVIFLSAKFLAKQYHQFTIMEGLKLQNYLTLLSARGRGH